MLSTRPLALDDGPATYAYTRTPAKGLLKNRGALQENTTTVLRAPKTLNTGKGKAVALRTPTQNRHSARKNGNAFQTAKKLTTVVSTKPLGDKTPFPNRQLQALQTPAPQTAKLAKLQLSLDDDGESALGIGKTPGNLLLPSARRKSMRLPRSASKKFRTPDGQGRHQDVSDGDVRLEVDEDGEEAVMEEPDYDEVEYMPPKVPEQPYEPLLYGENGNLYSVYDCDELCQRRPRGRHYDLPCDFAAGGRDLREVRASKYLEAMFHENDYMNLLLD